MFLNLFFKKNIKEKSLFKFFFCFTLLLYFFTSLLLPFFVNASYSSNICSGILCDQSEVGPFMQNITKNCGNLGDCTLDDIMMVFVNISKFILGVVGAFVFLMYIFGGLHFVAAGGNSDRIKKGKQFIKISTVGLLIVLLAYTGVLTITGALLGSNSSLLGYQVKGTMEHVGIKVKSAVLIDIPKKLTDGASALSDAVTSGSVAAVDAIKSLVKKEEPKKSTSKPSKPKPKNKKSSLKKEETPSDDD